MLKDIFASITSAARKLFTNFGATLIALLLYALLLLVLYIFFTTGVGTVTHVLLSLVVLPLAAVVLFFVLQALAVSYVRIGVGPGYLLRRALQDCWKLLLVSLPLLLVAGLLSFGFGWLAGKLSYEQSRAWQGTLLSWSRFVVLYLALPLMAIHLWLAAAREGAGNAYRGFFRHLGRAFAPRAVAIYALLFAVFGVAVYFLLFTRTQFGGAWVEMGLLGGRLALALLLVFVGWWMTVGALAEVTALSIKTEME
ncbi:MAG: hypothetical protein HYR56_01155 [Acidobacteria bacterium]|nr:hypothetical protein [Acidobacteriota bacterium]MBI3426901.1 hypothetical protein [Acidobacteriota bacterium]